MPIIPMPPLPSRVFAPDLLAGRTALVTGASGGIGRAIAEGLAEAGADLLLAARNLDKLEQVAAPIREKTGRRVECATVNIRDRDTVEELAAFAAQRFPRIDILVNNAGGQFAAPARDYKPKGWNAVIETNLTGTWNMTQVFGVPMLDGDGGNIVNIIAVAERGMPGIAHTAAARAGVLALSRSLAYEWGPKVRINCVAPGPIVTAAFANTYDPEVANRNPATLPIPRCGHPEEVGYAVTWLASPAAAWVTGEVIHVAGGQQFYGLNQAMLDEAFGRS